MISNPVNSLSFPRGEKTRAPGQVGIRVQGAGGHKSAGGLVGRGDFRRDLMSIGIVSTFLSNF